MVERASFENWYVGNRIGGSNPPASAVFVRSRKTAGRALLGAGREGFEDLVNILWSGANRKFTRCTEAVSFEIPPASAEIFKEQSDYKNPSALGNPRCRILSPEAVFKNCPEADESISNTDFLSLLSASWNIANRGLNYLSAGIQDFAGDFCFKFKSTTLQIES